MKRGSAPEMEHVYERYAPNPVALALAGGRSHEARSIRSRRRGAITKSPGRRLSQLVGTIDKRF